VTVGWHTPVLEKLKVLGPASWDHRQVTDVPPSICV
jgi:hypothetical protein